MSLVDVVWEGPFPAQIGHVTLQPGDEYQVSEADAESDHWRRKDKPKSKSKPKTQSKAKTAAASPSKPSDPPDPAPSEGGDS